MKQVARNSSCESGNPVSEAFRALIVDDNQSDRTLAIRALKQEFQNLHTEEITRAEDLADALERGDFDLVITDYQLHWTDGLSVLRAVKARFPHRPVVMFTGTGSEEIAVEAMKSGLDDYVLKTPKHFIRLPAAVRMVMEKAGQRLALEEAQRNLQEQFHFLQRLIDTIPNALAYKDTKGIYLGCNKAFEQEYGVPREKVIGKTIHDLFSKELADLHEEMDKKLLSSPGTQIYEAPILHPDGGMHETMVSKATFTNLDGSIGGVVGVHVDISERKRAEQERILLATAIEQSAESIVITDRSGAIRYVNPAFERITGYSREEAIGKNPRILKSGKQDRGFYRSMWDAITRGQVWSGHLTNKKKDGTLYEEEATISPVRNGSGEIVNFVAVKRDVTQDVHLKRLFRQAQKMEALGTLAGGIAHDFNNILGAIMGYSELALVDAPQDVQLRSNLDQVLKASHRAKELVRQILAFSRQGEQEYKPVHAGLIVKEALKLLRASLPTTIEIRQSIESKALVLADPTQIHQVLMNLCTNSSHAMQESGGVLEVSLRDVEVEDPFTQRCPDLQAGSYQELSISDTGHGIDRAIIERIFDPYFTTKSIGEGTGLGLAVVHGIVKSHGGSINVYSEPGKGTTFHVYFPRIEPEKSMVSEAEAFTPMPGGTERVLFIDDEKPLADMGQQMLERLGYQVSARTSPIEALRLFRNHPDTFDLVISDLTMPHMTGLDLAKELIMVRPEIPIIICTGFSHTLSGMTPEKARKMGIREIITKPIIMRNLAEAVRKALAEEKNGNPEGKQ